MKHTVLVILKCNSKNIYISNVEYDKICFGRACLNMQYAFVRLSLDLVSKAVSSSTNNDNNDKHENTSITIMEARARNDTRAEFAILKSLHPRAAAKPQAIKLEDGSMARNPIECRKRWQRFFADKLCGKLTTLAMLAESTRERHSREFRNICNHAPYC